MKQNYKAPKNDSEVIQSFYSCPKGSLTNKMIEKFLSLRQAGKKLDDAYIDTLNFALSYYFSSKN